MDMKNFYDFKDHRECRQGIFLKDFNGKETLDSWFELSKKFKLPKDYGTNTYVVRSIRCSSSTLQRVTESDEVIKSLNMRGDLQNGCLGSYRGAKLIVDGSLPNDFVQIISVAEKNGSNNDKEVVCSPTKLNLSKEQQSHLLDELEKMVD